MADDNGGIGQVIWPRAKLKQVATAILIGYLLCQGANCDTFAAANVCCANAGAGDVAD